MLETRQRTASEDFHSRMDELRSKIDSAPRQHREMLLAAADKAQEYHGRLQRACNSVQGVVADLSLIIEYRKFDAAARRRECRGLNL
jgi:hypothetical protein